MSSPRVWFITGASSGFGLAMTKLVLQSGDIAVATLRKPEVLADLAAGPHKDRLLIIKLDVSNPDQISSAFAKTKEVFGRLDVVFNNAGWGVLSEIEGTPNDVAHSMFETDFWGAANVSREAVQFFREVNAPGVGGRLIQVTSMAGIDGVPSIGYYSASKAALEVFTESLSKELVPSWNIKVTNITLGAFKTSIADPNSSVLVPPHPAYSESITMMIRQQFQAGHSGDINKAAKVIYKLSGEADPPIRLPLGLDAVKLVKTKGQALMDQAEKYEAWSADLQIDN